MNSMKKSTSAKALEQLRRLCFDLPEAAKVEAWGHPTFRAGKKTFAACGFERQEELLKDGGVSLTLNENPDWDELKQLVREAYKQVALKRMLAALGDD